jgi:small subunit ribosomal protein S4e
MSKKQHLSRLAAPRTWPIPRKGIKWVSKPLPGTNSMAYSLPINVVLRDILGIVKTTREVKRFLHTRDILVNNKAISEERFAVGLLDVISIPKLKKHYRIIFTKQGKLNVITIPESEASTFLLKITDKKQLAKDKIQINLSNGWNILVKKDTYKTNDVIVLDTKTRKIREHLQFAINNIVYFTRGKHISKVAKLLEVKETGKLRKQKVAVVENGKEKWESSIDNLILVGKTKPMIKLTNEN